jgi:23S rRNA pseudouridine2457 synthase
MKPTVHQYFVVYKPFQVLCQFTSTEGKLCLKDFFSVPQNVYPVGRLDYDSEGLLLLTNDASLNKKILNPKSRLEKEYWVQVEGAITMAAIQQLQKGVSISVDGSKYTTKPCKAKLMQQVPNIPERIPPIRFRKNIPTSWLSLIIKEGKNRQVRKMTAAVGFPTLRLLRSRIGTISLNNLLPGEMRELTHTELIQLLQ